MRNALVVVTLLGFSGIAGAQCVSQIVRLAPSDVPIGNRFGTSVAISGDIAVVGAPAAEESLGSAVYVFEKQSNLWIQTARLTLPDRPNHRFGVAVSIGPISRAIFVAAPRAGTTQGMVSAFTKIGSAWTGRFDAELSSSTIFDGFGRNVLVSASVQSGFEEVFASGADNVYRQRVSSSSPLQGNFTGVNYFASNSAALASYGDFFAGTASSFGSTIIKSINSQFNNSVNRYPFGVGGEAFVGYSLAMTENLLAMGVPGSFNQPNSSGSVALFRSSGQVYWGQFVSIYPSDGQFGDFFGASVGASPTRLVVGAPYANAPAVDSGAAYVFTKQGTTTWTQTSKLAPGDLQSSDEFGQAVAIDGNVAIVGAPGVSGSRGAAYIFNLAAGGPIIQQLSPPRTISPGERVQLSVSAEGTGTLTYQWFKGGLPLQGSSSVSGVSTPTLTIDPAELSTLGNYSVRITDSCGTTASSNIFIGVRCPSDFNRDGVVDLFDYLDFVSSFASGC
ncbi:MAG: immunoglobulin domain-containing protein [Planctomycetes bacterium]|nr:immunoglobulin domain-containing protein [Planctomycetota bacterium]